MERKSYPSDLSNDEWEKIKIYFPDTVRSDKKGRPRSHSKKRNIKWNFLLIAEWMFLEDVTS